MALIYIVEDDQSIREIETIALKNANHTVVGFDKGSDFFEKLSQSDLPELVLLDVMLPDSDGYEIVRKLRANSKWRKIPVIMVTAKTTEMDMIKGFDDGADDYIRKPFSIMELLSRVKAMLRRTNDTDEEEVITIGKIQLDNERHAVVADGEEVDLTYKEYELLRYLMINRNIVLSRESIMRVVWGTDFEGESRTVDVHIRTLRHKLGDPGKQIKTVRNVGYVMESNKEQSGD